MMQNVICYTTKEPVVYNRGTKWEKQCSDFLYRYTYKDLGYAIAKVEKMNQMLADGVEKFDGLDLTTIAKFYLSEQEEMY